MLDSIQSSVAGAVNPLQYAARTETRQASQEKDTDNTKEVLKVEAGGRLTTSVDGDMAVISAEGVAFTESATAKAEQKPDSLGLTNETALESSDTAGLLSSISDDETDTTDTDDLSRYTEAELREMLSGGEITQQEYNEEMASRSTEVTVDT